MARDLDAVRARLTTSLSSLTESSKALRAARSDAKRHAEALARERTFRENETRRLETEVFKLRQQVAQQLTSRTGAGRAPTRDAGHGARVRVLNRPDPTPALAAAPGKPSKPEAEALQLARSALATENRHLGQENAKLRLAMSLLCQMLLTIGDISAVITPSECTALSYHFPRLAAGPAVVLPKIPAAQSHSMTSAQWVSAITHGAPAFELNPSYPPPDHFDDRLISLGFRIAHEAIRQFAFLDEAGPLGGGPDGDSPIPGVSLRCPDSPGPAEEVSNLRAELAAAQARLSDMDALGRQVDDLTRALQHERQQHQILQKKADSAAPPAPAQAQLDQDRQALRQWAQELQKEAASVAEARSALESEQRRYELTRQRDLLVEQLRLANISPPAAAGTLPATSTPPPAAAGSAPHPYPLYGGPV
ncbi:hypothetical protein H696_05706 [Fonticula alba]|uniref:Uncharacterized protein n=1 Tax=Fonticula alba TaxID=691883 RepID=A0A058Z1E8_FONAL|nr:hypothetical protein H696_05706 [Fonticula alba]KCV67763.1 hypothetical protein H696_05706 [Fonticula alba]|eukprot:XP_009497794.1 hypothetical protein H696_05706 [Fonticula alba]